MSIDRADALAELADPATEAERLAEIAYAHPDLGAKIVAHANVYPDLVEWLTSYGSVDEVEPDEPESGPEADAADEDPPPPPPGDEVPPPPPADDDAPPPPPGDDVPPPPPADGDAPPPPPPGDDVPPAGPKPTWSRRTKVIVAAIAAAVLVLGGTTAVLATQGVFGGSSSTVGQIACPDGSSAVMWSDWEGGATLVCEFDGGGYTMIVGANGSVERSDDVTATVAGFRSPLGEIAFGGWAFWPRGSDGFVVTSWGDTEHGESSNPLSVADGIPPCPANSFALSLSVWDGGWLLTCGTIDGTQTGFSFDADGVSGSGGTMELDGGRYCGEATTSAEVCVSIAPALVQISDGSDVSRFTVATNYFGDTGFGGAGQGTGAYGVEAPGDTAQEQVGYLVAILEKSRAARATVSGALAPLNACSVSSGDVQNLRNLHQARTDLLVALRTTPVDQVPDGDRLLAMLTEAISLSEQAIVGYIATGEQMAGGDCGGGRATYRNAIAIADQAEASKQRFVDAWNAQIVPAFGVPAFTARDI